MKNTIDFFHSTQNLEHFHKIIPFRYRVLKTGCMFPSITTSCGSCVCHNTIPLAFAVHIQHPNQSSYFRIDMSDKKISFAVEMRIFFKDGIDNKDFFWCGKLEILEKREEFPRNSQKTLK